MEGSHCPLAHRGYSRGGKNRTQIEYDLLTDPAGRPVAILVFPDNTADPTAFIDAVGKVRTRFGLAQMVMVGDRGMITTARIDALRAEDGDLSWLSALRALIPTSVPAQTPDAASVVDAYTNLASVEPDFRTINTDDLNLRPIYHRLTDRSARTCSSSCSPPT